MATSLVLKDVEEQLTCPICLSLYEDPKVLNCHHAFCVICLKKCVVTDRDGLLLVRCSTCRAATPVPAGGVHKLEVAFNVNKLFDTRAKLMTVTAAAASKKPALNSKKCMAHPERDRELWCESCSVLICFQCSLEDEEHHQHKFYLASKLKDQATQELKSSLDMLSHQYEGYKSAIRDVDDHVEKIYKRKDVIEKEVNEVATLLRKEISSIELSAVKKLYSMVEDRVTKLAPYRDKLENTSGKFKDCIAQIEGQLDRSDPWELTETKNELCGKALSLCETTRPNAFLSLDGNGEPELFVNLKKIKQTFADNFFVFECDVCPDNFKITGEGLSKAVVGENNSFMVQAFTSDGNLCTNPVQDLHCQLISNLTGESIHLSMMKQMTRSCLQDPPLKEWCAFGIEESVNSFVFSYCPLYKGWYTLSIEYKGRHLYDSPFRIPAYSKDEDGFKQFHTIDTAPGAEAMIVSDGRLVISSHDSLTQITGTIQKNIGFFEGSRLLILALKKGNIYFAVDRHNREHLFEIDISNGEQNTIRYYYVGIADIAYSGVQNCLFVLLSRLNAGFSKYVGFSEYVEIYSFSNPDKPLSFGSRGSGKSQLSSPKGITIDEQSNHVYIADTNNYRIQIFNFQGRYLSKFGMKVWNSSAKPEVLTFSCQKLFVGDSINRVHMFNCSGVPLLLVTLHSHSNIVSLAVDECDILYVCDSKNSKVLMY